MLISGTKRHRIPSQTTYLMNLTLLIYKVMPSNV